MSTPTPEVLDALRELVNIASGNAATALALLVGQRTMISVPRVSLEPIGRVASLIGAPADPIVAVTMELEGDVTGALLFLMPVPHAHALSARLLGYPAPGVGPFDADGQSALEETANVLAGAYTGALGTVIAGVVMISVPAFAVEPPDDALDRYRRQAATTSQALCIETSIAIGDDAEPCGAHLVLLPTGTALVETLAELAASY